MSDDTQISADQDAAASPDPIESTDAAASPDPVENTDPAADGTGGDDITEQVRDALRAVIDPELGINIVDLGLVYDVEVDDGAARVTMTLTSPGCPAGGQLLGGAKDAAETVEGVEEAVVSLVWKPFWTPEKMDPKVRAMLGF